MIDTLKKAAIQFLKKYCSNTMATQKNKLYRNLTSCPSTIISEPSTSCSISKSSNVIKHSNDKKIVQKKLSFESNNTSLSELSLSSLQRQKKKNQISILY